MRPPADAPLRQRRPWRCVCNLGVLKNPSYAPVLRTTHNSIGRTPPS
jgi:hypothetical protein